MSIIVECPNPDCAKVHKVKNRYAGKRCYCPDCNLVFTVPGTPLGVVAVPLGHETPASVDPYFPVDPALLPDSSATGIPDLTPPPSPRPRPVKKEVVAELPDQPIDLSDFPEAMPEEVIEELPAVEEIAEDEAEETAEPRTGWTLLGSLKGLFRGKNGQRRTNE
jgi:hypothetical protein